MAKLVDYSPSVVTTQNYDKKSIKQKKIFVVKVNQVHPNENNQYSKDEYYRKFAATKYVI